MHFIFIYIFLFLSIYSTCYVSNVHVQLEQFFYWLMIAFNNDRCYIKFLRLKLFLQPKIIMSHYQKMPISLVTTFHLTVLRARIQTKTHFFNSWHKIIITLSYGMVKEKTIEPTKELKKKKNKNKNRQQVAAPS